ncbi:MAG: 4-(cytidine 5'-diphospho)-2-C-methyl-D-erythritol kinase [Burkholderiaceae bacterium]
MRGTNRVYPAPAKLNLFLHVVGRRDDGYHLIQSVMQLIDLADDVTITPNADGRIARDGDVPGVAEDDDLTIRAARLLQAASGVTDGATIGIVKRIPIGGGLGGGSSDAATVLLALNRLWGLDWPRERLMALGLRLGADVPFFIGGTAAFAEGIGERLTPISLPKSHYVLVHPGVSVPTAAIFGATELTRDTEVIRLLDFSKNGSAGIDTPPTGSGVRAESHAGPGVFRNDLEPVVRTRFDVVREALDWLSPRNDDDWAGALGLARMSGSGACVFRAFDSTTHAAACIAALPAQWTGWMVRSLETHPLMDPVAMRQ